MGKMQMMHRLRWLLAIGSGTVVAAFLLLQSTAFSDYYQEHFVIENTEVALEEVEAPEPAKIEVKTPVASAEFSLEQLPDSKILTGGRQMFQTFNNCGPASLSMALSHLGTDVSQEVLGRDLRPYQNAAGNNDDKSVTLTELASKAEDYNYHVYHRPAGNVELVKHFINYDIPVITRTWLRPGEDIGHYRVIKGFDETAGVFIQDDSLQGANLRYTYEDYDELWRAFNYEFLVIVPEEKVAAAEAILGEINDWEIAWELALENADRALAENPNDTYAGFNRSVALYYLGRYAESVEAYEKVESQLPGRMLWYQIEPIQAYFKLENYDRVMAISSRILNNQNLAFSELHQLRGMILDEQGKEAEAERSYALASQYNQADHWLKNLER